MENIKHDSGLDRILYRMGFTPMAVIGLVLLLLLPNVPYLNQEYMIRWLAMAAWMGACAIAFDFTSGYISIVNFGFAAFVGLGGYTSAILGARFGLSPWIGIFVGAAVAALVGFVLGIITLRLRGIFAACLAWFAGLAMMGLATKMVWLTRGPLGLRADLFFNSESNVPYYYLIIAMMVVTYIICKWVVRSPAGLAFRAIGQNMEAARTSGIKPVKYRVLNFTLSCALAGWLGGFYAHFIGILTPELMHTQKTVEILVIAYIGGRGSLWGGVLTAFPFVFAMENIRSTLANLPGVNLIIYGVFLIAIMLYYPGGAAALYAKVASLFKGSAAQWLFTGRRGEK